MGGKRPVPSFPAECSPIPVLPADESPLWRGGGAGPFAAGGPPTNGCSGGGSLGALGGGLAVLMTPVGGRQISPRLPPPEDVLTYLETLPAKESPVAPAEHPWIKSLMTRTPREDILIARCVEVLSRRKWRIVHHHGDFAPWNLLRIGKGKLAAVDWEFASAEGFPYVDLAHYIIQVGALMYRWRAGKVLSWGVRYLSNPTIIGLSQAEATAIVQ